MIAFCEGKNSCDVQSTLATTSKRYGGSITPGTTTTKNSFGVSLRHRPRRIATRVLLELRSAGLGHWLKVFESCIETSI